MQELRVYTTMAGDIPRLVEQKKAMCFVEYQQHLEIVKELEQKIKQLEENNND